MSCTRSCLAVPFVLSSFAVACGASVVGNGDDTTDSGTSDAKPPHSDGGARPEAAPPSDAAKPRDAGGPVESSTPGSTVLAPGKDLVLWGVTSDGYAIYATASLTTTTVYAVSLAGGTPVMIDTLTSSYSEVLTAGNLVIVLNDVTSTGEGTLEIWSSKGGLHTIVSTAYAYEFDLDSAFAHIAYFGNYDSTAMTADAYVANVDGTGATLLQSAVPGLGQGSKCYPEIAFAGSSPVLAYCTTPPTTGNIESFASPSWAMTPVESSVYPYFVADPAGNNLMFLSSAGMQVIPAAGGTATMIDANGQNGLFTSDGANIVYVTSGGGLYTSPIASPSPTMLVSSGLEGIAALSPDNSTALVYKNYDQSTYTSDLYAASAVTSGPLTTLSSATTAAVGSVLNGGIVYGSSFTSDSSHALFFTGVSTASYPYLGMLQSGAPGATSPSTLGPNSNTVFASGKTKAVFEDNFLLASGSIVATVDIKSVDTAAGGTPTVVVSQANAGPYYGSFFLSPDGTKIVYTQNGASTSTQGVLVVPVP
jgi:hypothetical protein